MRFTIWQRKPERETLFQPLARDAEELEIQLVHWTGDGATVGTECRAITIAVNASGDVTVEHSTSTTTGTGIDPEEITRVYLPAGWEDE